MKRLSAGTLFSGIGAPECAAPGIDWRWSCEIDPFACAVHAARFPNVTNLGDILEIDWHAVEPVDLVVGGPPCQDYSVAGQRASLSGARGDLTLQYAHILDAIDPAWSVTENVPGWLSTPDNAFGAFLGILVGADAALVPGRGQRWIDAGVVAGPRRTAAWRILDAQYFGVPQRRRRVFVVACRGAGNWQCAEALFPLRESLRRDTAPRRQAREDIAAGAGDGTSFSLKTPSGGGCTFRGDGADNLVAPIALRGHSDYGDGLPSLRADSGDCGGGSEALVAFQQNAGRDFGADADRTPPLRSGGHGTNTLAIAFGGNNTAGPIDVATACRAKGGTGHGDFESETFVTDGPLAVQSGMSVRRLTPRECARLQGFPDDWCAIDYRGKPAADGPMYRAYGNSMAVPCVGWVLRRVQEVHAAAAEREAAA
jgi:DNA (cytosine-5)-methyltransferase 1